MSPLLKEYRHSLPVSSSSCSVISSSHWPFKSMDYMYHLTTLHFHFKECNILNHVDVKMLPRVQGLFRDDTSGSRFPAQRVPMGLLQYMVDFYNADSYREVPVPQYVIGTWLAIINLCHFDRCRANVQMTVCHGLRPCILFLAISGQSCTAWGTPTRYDGRPVA